MRHAVGGIGRGQAGDVTRSAITDEAVGSAPAPLAVIEGRTDGITPDQHGIHRTLDVREQALGRNQRRMDAQFDALAAALGDAEQLDASSRVVRRT